MHPPPPVCSKYTGKAAASSTDSRPAATNGRFRALLLVSKARLGVLLLQILRTQRALAALRGGCSSKLTSGVK